MPGKLMHVSGMRRSFDACSCIKSPAVPSQYKSPSNATNPVPGAPAATVWALLEGVAPPSSCLRTPSTPSMAKYAHPLPGLAREAILPQEAGTSSITTVFKPLQSVSGHVYTVVSLPVPTTRSSSLTRSKEQQEQTVLLSFRGCNTGLLGRTHLLVASQWPTIVR